MRAYSVLPSLASLAAALAFLALPAAADETDEDDIMLAELFVSQNCGACPKAMRDLTRAARERDDVFVLTWSVDYWNYLGWHDTFAEPEFRERQKVYARQLDLRGPYTPMLVVNGRTQGAGSKKDKVASLLKDTACGMEDMPTESSLEVTVDKAADRYGYVIRISGKDLPALDLLLAEYEPGIRTVIPSDGPNRALEIDHENSVRRAIPVATWDAASPASFVAHCKGACALIVSEAGTGKVIYVDPDVRS